ncbi:MAG TPA: hypothetical protein VMX17_09375 [Candidatus Glassbacteria bacterium]|nr:hypothetical protein [Candidatus Glassbacteria bacterium]
MTNGIQQFKLHEGRDAIYSIASFLLDHFWGKPSKMTDALGVLLLTWNQAFYRYGTFNFGSLEKCIDRNLNRLDAFRRRFIFDLPLKINWKSVKCFWIFITPWK